MYRGYESRGTRERARWDAAEGEFRSQEREPGYPRSSEFEPEPYGEYGRGGRHYNEQRGAEFDRYDRGRRGYSGSSSYGSQERGSERGGGSPESWYGGRPQGSYSSQESEHSMGRNEWPDPTRSYNQGYGQGPGGYDFATPGSWRSDWRNPDYGYPSGGNIGREDYSGGSSGRGYGGGGGYGSSGYSGYGTGGGGYGRGAYGTSGYEGGVYGSGGYGGGYGSSEYSTGRQGGYGGMGREESYGRSSGRYGYQTAYPSAGEYTGRGPKNYRRSDERIRDDVNDRLTEDGEIDASEITVNVSGGEVTLTGTVADRRMKHRAESVADTVSGVKEVHNQIRVNRESMSEQKESEGSQSSAQRTKSSVATART